MNRFSQLATFGLLSVVVTLLTLQLGTQSGGLTASVAEDRSSPRTAAQRGDDSSNEPVEVDQSDAKDGPKPRGSEEVNRNNRPKIKPRRSSAAARAKGEINFDDLVFDLEKDKPFKDDLLTKDIRELNNRRVKLRGYILPSTLFKETDISQFVLVRDNQECCFGPGAALFDCVIVEMVPGRTTDFVTRPVTVEGKFEIDTKKYRYPSGGRNKGGPSHMAVFRIKGESVR